MGLCSSVHLDLMNMLTQHPLLQEKAAFLLDILKPGVHPHVRSGYGFIP